MAVARARVIAIEDLGAWFPTTVYGSFRRAGHHRLMATRELKADWSLAGIERAGAVHPTHQKAGMSTSSDLHALLQADHPRKIIPTPDFLGVTTFGKYRL